MALSIWLCLAIVLFSMETRSESVVELCKNSSNLLSYCPDQCSVNCPKKSNILVKWGKAWITVTNSTSPGETMTLSNEIFTNLSAASLVIESNSIREIIPPLEAFNIWEILDVLMITSKSHSSFSADWINCKAVRIIEVTNGNLSSILDPSTTNRCSEKLQTVKFKNNQLTTLPENFLSACTNLISLDLSSNKLTSLSYKLMNNLHKLKIIRIQQNRLKKLEPQLFINNTELEEVDLSQNSLEVLSLQLFSKPNQIRFLNLSKNFLSYLPQDLLFGSHLLEELSLSSNKLLNLSSDLLSKSCSHLRILQLQNNNLNSLPKDIFKSCTNLYILNLFKNPLKYIEPQFLPVCGNFNFISIDKNHLESFPEDFLQNCTNLQGFTSTYSSLQQLPPNFLQAASNITNIILRNNALENLPNGFLGSKRQLTFLDLSRNKLKNLFPENFKMNIKMDLIIKLKIDLSYNQLEKLPQNLFQWSNNIVHLDLSHNNISELKTGWNKNLQVQTLNLSYNQLSSLQRRDFLMLSTLEELDLSRNKIAFIDEITFFHLENLTKIDLSFNELNSLAIFPILPISLQHFNISANKLSFFPRELARCSNLMSLDLSKNIIETLEIAKMIVVLQNRPCQLLHPINIMIEDNPGSCNCTQFLTDLIIADKIKLDMNPCKEQGKRFGRHSSECLDSEVCLEKCSCSHNGNATIVNCKNLELQNIPIDDVVHPNMLFLQNNLIVNGSGLENPQWQFLELLDMSNALKSSNSSAILDSIPFQNFHLLDTLSLSSNHLLSLSENLLWKLGKLKFLDISDNLLRILPKKLFQNSHQLQQLDISNNLIESIDWNTFASLSALRVLILKNNLLSHISLPSSFLNSLNELDLSRNSLQFIKPIPFSSLQNLKILDLSHNNLTDLEDSALFDVPQQLEALILRNNGIKTFLSDKWVLPSISFLDISDNKISELQMNMFNNVTNNLTITINLQKNNIQTVKFADLDLINTDINIQFNLKDNMLQCDCDLKEFLTYINKSGKYSKAFNFITDSICHGPIFVKGQKFSSLLLNELHCPISENCPSPCLCFNSSNSGLILDCHGKNLSMLPAQIPDNVQTLYLGDNKIRYNYLESLQESKWKNLKKLYFRNCCLLNSSSPVISSFDRLHHLLYLDLDSDCHCEELDYVRTGMDGISGNCRYLDRRPTCFLKDDGNTSSVTGMVQCSNQFKDRHWEERTVCFVEDQCSDCDCYLNANQSVVMNCSSRGLQQLPRSSPPSVKILDFSNNSLIKLQDLSKNHWKSLTKAIFRGNLISEIKQEILPLNLSFISLEDNKLKKPSGWLSDIMKSSSKIDLKITLSGNPWICDCQKAPEVYADWSLLRMERLMEKKNSTFCETEGIKPQALLLINEAICSTESDASRRTKLIAVLVSMLLTLLAIVSLASALYYRHRKALRIWCFAHQFCQCACNELHIDDDKEFDAFLSYSSEDSEFIAKELLPGLEDKDLPHQFLYRICIHDRDWPGGDYIPDQIVLSVQRSRRIIIVLTENFLRSSWAALEFKIALQQALQDKINRLIIVVPYELPSKDDMDPDLRMYVTMNTYLMYNDSKFWDKLRYSMPHKTAGNVRHLPREFIELMAQQERPLVNNIPKIE